MKSKLSTLEIIIVFWKFMAIVYLGGILFYFYTFHVDDDRLFGDYIVNFNSYFMDKFEGIKYSSDKAEVLAQNGRYVAYIKSWTLVIGFTSSFLAVVTYLIFTSFEEIVGKNIPKNQTGSPGAIFLLSLFAILISCLPTIDFLYNITNFDFFEINRRHRQHFNYLFFHIFGIMSLFCLTFAPLLVMRLFQSIMIIAHVMSAKIQNKRTNQ